MLKSETKLITPNAHIIIGSLAAHSLGLDHVRVPMFATYRYGLVIYACILPTVFHHSTRIS